MALVFPHVGPPGPIRLGVVLVGPSAGPVSRLASACPLLLVVPLAMPPVLEVPLVAPPRPEVEPPLDPEVSPVVAPPDDIPPAFAAPPPLAEVPTALGVPPSPPSPPDPTGVETPDAQLDATTAIAAPWTKRMGFTHWNGGEQTNPSVELHLRLHWPQGRLIPVARAEQRFAPEGPRRTPPWLCIART